MQLETKLGSFEVEESKLITFPRGILGLEDYKKYIILDHPGTDVLKWLQSVEDTDIALPVILPEVFFPDYRPQFLKEDLLHLEIRSPEEALVLCIITVPQDPQKATVNLKAPVVINPHRRLADQIIAENEEYKVRQPLNLEKIASQRRCKSC
jgi:flagellar assembly factor FliW